MSTWSLWIQNGYWSIHVEVGVAFYSHSSEGYFVRIENKLKSNITEIINIYCKTISTLCRTKFGVNYVFSCEWSKIYLWWQPIDRLLFCYNIATVGLTDSGMKQMKRVEYGILSIVFMMWVLKLGWRIVWKRIRIRQKRILLNWKICLAKHIMNRIGQTVIRTAKKLRFNIWGKQNIARLVSWIISVYESFVDTYGARQSLNSIRTAAQKNMRQSPQQLRDDKMNWMKSARQVLYKAYGCL